MRSGGGTTTAPTLAFSRYCEIRRSVMDGSEPDHPLGTRLGITPPSRWATHACSRKFSTSLPCCRRLTTTVSNRARP